MFATTWDVRDNVAVCAAASMHIQRPASHPPLRRDAQGFVLQQHDTAVKDFHDENEVKAIYYSEVEQVVKDLTEASKVIVFDHNVRSSSKAARSRTGTYPPARFAHADYTLSSGPQRVRDLLSSTEAGKRLERRFVFLNVEANQRAGGG